MKKLAFVIMYLIFLSCINSKKNDSKTTTPQSVETFKNNDSNDNTKEFLLIKSFGEIRMGEIQYYLPKTNLIFTYITILYR